MKENGFPVMHWEIKRILVLWKKSFLFRLFFEVEIGRINFTNLLQYFTNIKD